MSLTHYGADTLSWWPRSVSWGPREACILPASFSLSHLPPKPDPVPDSHDHRLLAACRGVCKNLEITTYCGWGGKFPIQIPTFQSLWKNWNLWQWRADVPTWPWTGEQLENLLSGHYSSPTSCELAPGLPRTGALPDPHRHRLATLLLQHHFGLATNQLIRKHLLSLVSWPRTRSHSEATTGCFLGYHPQTHVKHLWRWVTVTDVISRRLLVSFSKGDSVSQFVMLYILTTPQTL